VTQAAAQSADVDTEGNEVYRLQAEGRVHIFTPTDQAWGDLATYDIDQAVLVLTGRNIRLTTPNDVVTARDDVEYWSQKHMAVARGNAVVVTDDGRRLAADTLVAYTSEAPSPPAAAIRQAGEGRGVRQRLGPHHRGHGDRRSGGVRSRQRHRARRRTGAHHARPEPARRVGSRGQPEDQRVASAGGKHRA